MNRKDQLFRSAFLEAVRNEERTLKTTSLASIGQLDPEK
jgi:hypothetical protein